MLFQIRGTVSLQKLGIGVERCDAGVEKDILEVNSLLLFRKKDLHKLFECCDQFSTV